MSLQPELLALDTYRLKHDWSWTQLADEMSKVGVHMSSRTLHYLCRRAHDDAQVRDRTLLKVRKFLKRKGVRFPAREPATYERVHVPA
jgi:hypothetical protein